MRLQLYVPKAQAERWSAEGMSFGEFQQELVGVAGGITVTQSVLFANALPPTSVLVVEALLPEVGGTESTPLFYVPTRNLLICYAQQLIRQGERRVLLVRDNEPTYIEHA